MNAITISNVKERYRTAKEMIEYNKQLALDTSAPKALWAHHPTLARWLYGSAQQFIADYFQATREFLNSGEISSNISGWNSHLNSALSNFKVSLEIRFRGDKQLMEALKR